MRREPSHRRSTTFLVFVLAFAGAASLAIAREPRTHRSGAASETASSPLTLADVTRLIDEGVGSPVIVRQVRRNRIDFEPTVNALVRLRRAGADDAVLEAVMDCGDEAAGGEIGAMEPDRFRIFHSWDENGQKVVVLTNLDDRGRRIGGESTHPQPPNVVLSPEPPLENHRTDRRFGRRGRGADEDAGDDDVRAYRREAEAVPAPAGPPASPVTVVINNNAPSAPPVATYPGAYPFGVVAYGGFVGGFKYPDKLFFLGYDPRTSPTIPSNPPFGNIRITNPALAPGSP